MDPPLFTTNPNLSALWLSPIINVAIGAGI